MFIRLYSKENSCKILLPYILSLHSLQVSGVTVDTNTSQLVSLGGGSQWQHSLNIVDTKLETSGQFR